MNEIAFQIVSSHDSKMFATKWETFSWDWYMWIRIRNNCQSWLDQSSVQSMGTNFKEMMVNKKEVDKNGKLDKCNVDLLSKIFWSILFWVYLLFQWGQFPMKHGWGDNVYVSPSAFLGM